MTAHLYLAPAAQGKTAYAVDLARRSAGLQEGRLCVVRVVVASGLQVRAFRRRLAAAGGALGIRVTTVDRLYAECLAEAGALYTELSEPVLYRLVASLIAAAPLQHYAGLAGMPGFTSVVLDLFGELKANRVEPEAFRRAVAATGAGPRLGELAELYAAYQARLQQQGWADRAGLGWLALDTLEAQGSQVAAGWPLVIFDGFDDFSAIQLAVVQRLASRAGSVVVTLTGEPQAVRPRPGNAHLRFTRTRDQLERALGLVAEPLPQTCTRHAPALAALESCLYRPCSHSHDSDGRVDLITATDRVGEVRAALRWLKERIVLDGFAPSDVALLARNITPYRPFIEQIAGEFGLPVRLAAGSPLAANPAVAALSALLALAAPAGDGSGPALPRRGVIDAWRCPYFNWGEALRDVTVSEGDAEALDRLARWGRVTGGQAQWAEMFARLAGATVGGDTGEDDRGSTLPLALPEALALQARFRAFVSRISPPPAAVTYRAFAAWLEDLIGADAAEPWEDAGEGEPAPSSLGMAACAAGVAATAGSDLLALRTLKQVLLGLVWAEETLGATPIDFPAFLVALSGAIAGATCTPPVDTAREEILAADVIQTRGLAFGAVALLGLAEGEFPALISEDHFMRDDDRIALRAYDVNLRPSTESNEAEYFYEAACRARERLLLTRPRIADNGATWLPSPYWEEVRRIANTAPRELAGSAAPSVGAAASWPELLTALAHHGHDHAARAWADSHSLGGRGWGSVAFAGGIVAARSHTGAQAECDGWLESVAPDCRARFGPGYYWSASALETYRNCPFRYYVSRVLKLYPREDPAEDLDIRQRGNIFHRLLERTYRETADPTSLPALQAALARVAPAVLDEAPEREGFRATRWWLQTRAEISTLAASGIEKLVSLGGELVPRYFEVEFSGRVAAPGGGFFLRGTIDRVDVGQDGAFRIVDYKSGKGSAYKLDALQKGKKLQLGLYAAATRDVLGLGEPVSGFYFHLDSGEPSDLRLEAMPGGVEAAIATALAYADQVIAGVQTGSFTPEPPSEGCPAYCSAAAFCWHYAPARWSQ